MGRRSCKTEDIPHVSRIPLAVVVETTPKHETQYIHALVPEGGAENCIVVPGTGPAAEMSGLTTAGKPGGGTAPGL
jgi:hypothetical protein